MSKEIDRCQDGIFHGYRSEEMDKSLSIFVSNIDEDYYEYRMTRVESVSLAVSYLNPSIYDIELHAQGTNSVLTLYTNEDCKLKVAFAGELEVILA